MAQNVFLSAIFIGNFPDLDTNEGNFGVEGRDTLLGQHGSQSAPLSRNITTIDSDSPTAFIDRDDDTGNGTLTYDIGSGPVTTGLDALVFYNSVVTFSDGTTSAVRIDVIQAQNGDVFILAFDNSPALGEKAIESVSLDSVIRHTDPGIRQSDFDTVQFVCFTKGTFIKTPEGEKLIESLSIGDLVSTLDHGPQVIRWIGHSMISAEAQLDKPSLRPIRFSRGSLGHNMPQQTLRVSQQHRILARSRISERMFNTSEILIAAKKLLSIPGVEVEPDLAAVDYYHLLFDDHQIIYANGLLTESLLPGPIALKAVGIEAANEIRNIFPEFFSSDFLAISARFVPSGHKVKALCSRHIKNKQAFVVERL